MVTDSKSSPLYHQLTSFPHRCVTSPLPSSHFRFPPLYHLSYITGTSSFLIQRHITLISSLFFVVIANLLLVACTIVSNFTVDIQLLKMTRMAFWACGAKYMSFQSAQASTRGVYDYIRIYISQISINPLIYLFIYLFYLSTYPSILSVYLYICLSIYLSINLTIYLFYLTLYLSIYSSLSINMSIDVSITLSINLSM